jgi:hypothetical protein
LSVFLIVALVALFAYGAYQVGVKNSKPALENTAMFPGEALEVKMWMHQCIEQAAQSAARMFGEQGGLYSYADAYLATETGDFNYYVWQDKNIMPSNTFFEEQLSYFMEGEVINLCTDYELDGKGYDIRTGNPIAKTKIQNDLVFFDISYPVHVKKKVSTEFESFSVSLPYRIGHILNVSRTLANAVEMNPTWIDSTLISLQDAGIMVIQYDPCNQIYLILDNESMTSLDTSPYFHSFSVRHSDANCMPEEEFSQDQNFIDRETT